MSRKLPLGALVCVLALSACGSAATKSKTKSSSTTTAATTAAPLATTLTETASLTSNHGTATASLSAPPDSSVIFRTVYPAAFVGKAEQVRLTISQSKPTRWTVQARAGGQHAQAIVQSPNAKPITLVNLAYTCEAPPEPSICPAHDVRVKGTQTQLQFNAPAHAAVAITAKVGPVAPEATITPSTTLAVPTYLVREEVAATATATGSNARPAVAVYGSSASVKPGDRLTLLTGLGGHLVGARQPVTISFAQGPAKAITVTADLPGGPPSTATIRSATGAPIEVILPTYRCNLPPRATACPATHIQAGHEHYSLTFSTGPQAPVLLSAVVQAG